MNETRNVPSNDHVWQELDVLIAQVRSFKERTRQRRQAFETGALELVDAEAKCDRILEQLHKLETRKAS